MTHRIRSISQYLENIFHPLFGVLALFAYFIYLSNSLTTVAEAFWSDCNHAWKSLWEYLLNQFGESRMFTLLTPALSACLYLLISAFFILVDYFQRPRFLLKYKTQPGKNQPLQLNDFAKAAPLILFNLLCVNPFVNLLLLPLMKSAGVSASLESFPTFKQLVYQFVFFTVVEEILFYYSHRLLHHRSIYGFIHKLHHEWTAPIAFVSIYAHPLEHIISNLIPAIAGPIILGSHLATVWCWLSFALVTTLNSHSGYHFPLFPSPEAHDYHHKNFNQCFGVLGILDFIHGTDAEFRKSRDFMFHETLFTLEYPRNKTQ